MTVSTRRVGSIKVTWRQGFNQWFAKVLQVFWTFFGLCAVACRRTFGNAIPISKTARLPPSLKRQEAEGDDSCREHPPLGHVHRLHDPVDVVDAFEKPRFNVVAHAFARH